MQYDQFIGAVQDRAHLPSRGEAERAVQATLRCLGERLTHGAARSLASQLPEMAAQHLEASTPVDRSGSTFGSDELIQRVAAVEKLDPPQAAHHIRAVLEVVQQATDPGAVDHVKDQLPGDYERLFAGSAGPMPA